MVGIYCRVSTKKQKDNYSTELQKSDGIAFAKEVGEDYTIYEDSYSGKTLERDGLGDIRKDVRNGTIKKFWVYAVNRLSRETKDGLILLDEMKQNDVSFYVNGVNKNLFDYDDYFMLTIELGLSTHQGQTIVKHSKAGIKKQRELGEQRYSQIFGYKKEIATKGYADSEGNTKHRLAHNWKPDFIYDKKGKIIKGEGEAEIVRFIFKQILKKKSFYQIIKELHDKSYKPQKAERFDNTTLRRMITRPAYCGMQYTDTIAENNTERPWIKSQVYEAIISIEDFQKAQEIYKATIKPNKCMGRKPSHMASGLIKCSCCNTSYFYHISNAKQANKIYKSYNHKVIKRCSQKPKSLKYDVVNDICFSIYINLLNDLDAIKTYKETLIKDIEETSLKKDKIRVEKNIAEYNKEDGNLKLAVAKGIYELDEVAEMRKEIKKKISTASKSLVNINRNISNLDERIKKAEYAFARGKLEEFWYSSDVEKRKLLNQVIEKATIKNFDITFELITGKSITVNYNKRKREMKEAENKPKVKSIIDALEANKNNLDLLYEIEEYTEGVLLGEEHDKIDKLEEKIK